MNVWLLSLPETLSSFWTRTIKYISVLYKSSSHRIYVNNLLFLLFFPKELCISVCKLLHAKSTLSNPNMEANPQPESQSSFQAVSRNWGVKLPWLQPPPHLNCNFLYFSKIQKDGSSTLRDPLITEKDPHKLRPSLGWLLIRPAACSASLLCCGF